MAKTIKRPTPVAITDYWFYLTILSVIFISIRFDTKTQDPFNLPKLGVLLLVLWLPLYLITRKANLLKKKLALFAALIPLGFICALIFSSIDSGNFYESLVGIYQRNLGISTYAFFVLLLVGIALNFTFKNYNFALFSFVTLGTLQTIYGLIQQLGADPFPWKNPYNPMIGTFGNPNYASAFLGCSAVACLALLATSKIQVKIFLVAQIILSVILVINSNSSQGLMAFVIGMSLFGLGYSYLKYRKAFLPTLIVVAAGGFMGLLGLLDKGPFQFLNQSSIAARGDYWRAAISMWKSSPITGVGFDQYGDYFGVHRDSAQVIGRGFLTQSDNAHNTFLHILATTGLIGAIFYVLIHLLIIVLALNYLRSAKSVEYLAMLSTFSIWISFVSISLISPDNLGVTVWLWVFAGLVLGQVIVKDNSVNTETLRNNYLMLAFCLVLTLIPSAVVVTKFTVADKCVWNTYLVGYSGTKSLPELNKLISDCVANGPKEDRYLALAASFSMGLKDYNQGIYFASKLAKQNSRSTDARRLSAYSYEVLSKYKEAIASRKRLEALNPMELENLKNLSLDYLAIKDLESALDYRNKIKSVDPMSGFIQEIDSKIAAQN